MEQKDKEEKYNLYTEHIVPTMGSNTKKIIKKVIYTILFGALFGVIAGGVMLLVFTGGNSNNGDDKEELTLGNISDNNKDDEDVTVSVPDGTTPSTEEVPAWDEELLGQIEEINQNYGVIKAIANRIKGYSVKVCKASDGVTTGYYNTNEAFGLVVAEDEVYYYILTDKDFVSGKDTYVVYGNGTSMQSEFVEADATTGFAIVRTPKSEEVEVEIAVLGSSSSITVGEIVVAVGELYGFVDSMSCGMVTGANVSVFDTDARFKIITTDIVGSANSFGVIADLNGSVTGIITTNYNTGTSNHVAAYAIDDVAGIIEKLMNGHKSSYLGVRGQEATEALYGESSIPKGIYITSVEINSPAYFAGMQPGDIITAIDNNSVVTMDQFMEALYAEAEGDTVEIKAKRKGREQYKEIVFNLTLGVE